MDTLLDRNVDIAAVYYPIQEPKQCGDTWLAYRRPVNSKATVIAVHGLGSNSLGDEGEASVVRFAVKPLLCAGFAVLTPDLRNHGNSSSVGPWTAGFHEAYDVIAATKWLVNVKKTDKHSIFLWGMSLGGASVLYAAARHPSYQAVAAEAPPATTGLVFGGFAQHWPSFLRFWCAFWHKSGSLDTPYSESLLKEARFITADVLHTHGTEDKTVPFINAEALQTVMEARAPTIDRFTGKPRIPEYRHFFHNGEHTSSWRYPKYFTMMLQFFSDAVDKLPHSNSSSDIVLRAPAVASAHNA
jgi:pimeloyl-ACP methyl ester carboxylesterase